MTRLRVKKKWWVLTLVAFVALAVVTAAFTIPDSGTASALDGAGTDGAGGSTDNPPAPTGRRCRISIMMDRSGSIGNPNYGGSDQYVNIMKMATYALAVTLQDQPVDLRIGVFATQAQWIDLFGAEMPWTPMEGVTEGSFAMNIIRDTIVGTPFATNLWTPPGGANTNWEAAIRRGSDFDSPGSRANVLLMLTDGEPTVLGWPGNNSSVGDPLVAARNSADWAQADLAAAGHTDRTRIIGLGIGSGVNDLAFAAITSSHDGVSPSWAYTNGVAFGNLLAEMRGQVLGACLQAIVDSGGGNPNPVDFGRIGLSITPNPSRPFPGQPITTTYNVINLSDTPVTLSGVTLDVGAGAQPLTSYTTPFGPAPADLAPNQTVPVVVTSTTGAPGPLSLTGTACYSAPAPPLPLDGSPCATAGTTVTVRPFEYLPT